MANKEIVTGTGTLRCTELTENKYLHKPILQHRDCDSVQRYMCQKLRMDGKLKYYTTKQLLRKKVK